MDSIVFTRLDNGNFHPFGMLIAKQLTPDEMQRAVTDYNNDPENDGTLYFGFQGNVYFSKQKSIKVNGSKS